MTHNMTTIEVNFVSTIDAPHGDDIVFVIIIEDPDFLLISTTKGYGQHGWLGNLGRAIGIRSMLVFTKI